MSYTVLPMLFLVFGTIAATPTVSELTARYGNPNAERFVVGPGITMMTKYSEDRTACEMFIEPEHSIRQPGDQEQSMATDTVSKVIDELIPESERGTLLNRMVENMGASEIQVAEYQNVTISRYFVRYLSANHDERSATVVRKDALCRSGIASQTNVPAIELNATNLRVRFGDPDVDRFLVRPGISLTVAYGTDRAACQMAIEQTHSWIPSDEPDKYMRPEAVTEIIDEILPEAERGELRLGVVTKSGCNDLENDDYQDFTVIRFRHRCNLPSPEIEGAATITRKAPSCGNAVK